MMVRLFRHPEDRELYLRPVYFSSGPTPAACLLYRRSDLDAGVRYWHDYDGRLDLRDDVQFHDVSLLERVDVPEEEVEMHHEQIVRLWYRIVDQGDGSAGLRWFFTEEAARDDEERDKQPFAEGNVDHVDAAIGSQAYWRAVQDEVWNAVRKS